MPVQHAQTSAMALHRSSSGCSSSRLTFTSPKKYLQKFASAVSAGPRQVAIIQSSSLGDSQEAAVELEKKQLARWSLSETATVLPVTSWLESDQNFVALECIDPCSKSPALWFLPSMCL